MTAGGRWIRLEVAWDDSDWVSDLEPAAQLAWIKLLCWTKAKGVDGSVKVMAPRNAAKKWDVPPQAVSQMLEAAKDDGAIVEAEGRWYVANWRAYQPADATATERKRKQRERERVNGTM